MQYKFTCYEKIISALLLMLLSVPGYSQWTTIHNMGADPNDGCFSFSVDGKAYVGGGSGTTKVFEYDTASGNWSYKSDIPAGAKNLAFSMFFSVSGKLYIVGGDTSGVVTRRVFMYDPVANSWTPKNDFPGGARDAGLSFVVNNTAYIGGGFDGSSLYNDLWKYNETSDAWTPVSALPVDPIIFPSSFVLNNTAYIVGGAVGSTATDEINTLWQYDAVNDKWNKKADFPGTARQAAFAFGYQNYGYFGGGMSDYTTIYKDVWRYNASTNKWTKVQDIPTICPAWSSSFTVGNGAYVGLGAAFVGSSLTGDDKFYSYRMVATGIAETNKEEQQVSIYPNPATNTIHVDAQEHALYTYTMYNVMGQEVMQGILSPKGNIDVSGLNRGQYILELTTSDNKTNKLISLH